MDAAALMLLLSLSGAEAVERPRPAPAPHCLDARRIERSRQIAPDSLLVLAGGEGFRVQLSDACADANGTAPERLLARNGWVCGAEREFAQAGARLCPVRAVEPLDARRYAELARSADRDAAAVPPDATLLDGVDVTAKAPPHRRFRGTHEYCFNPRWVTSWSIVRQEIVVRTRARRSGGHSQYRLELGGACVDLDEAPHVSFVSGVGIGMVCGNAGDKAVALGEVPVPGMTSADARLTRSVRTGSLLASEAGCPILAVYPD